MVNCSRTSSLKLSYATLKSMEIIIFFIVKKIRDGNQDSSGFAPKPKKHSDCLYGIFKSGMGSRVGRWVNYLRP